MRNRVPWTAVTCCLVLLGAVLAPAPAEAAQSQSVAIEVDLSWSAVSSGMVFWGPPPAYGTFGSTGAISDSGSASAYYSWYFFGAPPAALTLYGAKGTLSIFVSGDTWTIQGGTGAYANATGGGGATVKTTTVSWFGFVCGYRFQFALGGSVDLG
jgi:hypothetical protein